MASAGFVACEEQTTTPPPAVPIVITSPGDGATLHDSPTIRATPGAGYSFSLVEFEIDGDSVASDSTYPYEYHWNIFVYPSGTQHDIVALGYAADTVYVSDTVNVTVQFQTGLTLASSFATGSQAVGVTIYENGLFVSLGDAGIELLDVTSRASPNFVSRYDTPGQALHTDVQNPNVFVADRAGGVAKLDISDPDTLVQVALYNTGTLANDVAAAGQNLFVAENPGFIILRISNLSEVSQPFLPGQIFKYIQARGDTAFIVGDNGFYIVDCSNPMPPDPIGSFNRTIDIQRAGALAVSDTFAFIATGADGVIAISMSDPTSPRFLASYNPGQTMTSVDAGDGTLFAGSQSGILYVLDYSGAGNITEIDQLALGSDQIQEIDYQDYYIYVAANLNVYIARFIP
jgi:hypothetical protein